MPPAAPSGLSPSRGVVTLTGLPLPTFWIGRAVDQDGVVLEEILQKRRDKREAKRLLLSLMKRCGFAPERIITDKLRSYECGKCGRGCRP
uniref:DDE-type integrase/transposase/recombinase n=1 Tax=Agrobacterium tumefaciens TaxID=358 RepID=UPI002B1BDAA3|nr:DDE-type integrase/transposase/recombinase [Agrobacterium tumefaciens]